MVYAAAMSGYVGKSMGRPEDPAFLQGTSTYLADLAAGRFPGLLEAVFVRSPFGHARILGIETAAAAAAPGVRAVLTAADHEVFPAGSVFPDWFPPEFAQPILGEGTVRFAGEPVAVVVADSVAAAVDAAELVEVDWDPLPGVIDVEHARSDETVLFEVGGGARIRGGAPAPGGGTNVVLVHETEHDDAKFDAEVVVDTTVWNPRQLPTPIEPYGQITWWDGPSLHVEASTQRPHGFRDDLAALYDMDPDLIHVHTPAVGGGFGGKVSRSAAERALPMVARSVGAPVRWVQTRSEYFQGATQGRGERIELRLAGTADGRITALRGEVLKDSGAYPGVGANLPSRFNSHGAGGPYDIAHVEFSSVSVVTNAPQISAFRGAGRGPYLAALERAVDRFAAAVGLDPAEVRRRNLVRPEQMPFRAATGVVYDEADYPGDLERVLALAGYDTLRAEQAERRSRGDDVLLGVGIASYHHMTVGGGSEEARVEIEADGSATVYTGTTSQGHGHDATWAQIAADVLGIPIEQVRVSEGSTDDTPTGVGAVGSRSMQTAGVAIHTASTELVDRARSIAAAQLEAAVEDVTCSIEAGVARFHVAGVPAVAIGWEAIAGEVAGDPARREELICGEIHDVGENNSFPSGAHVAVVEIDSLTGGVVLRDFFGVDDCGVRVNPMIVEGQLHGGIASGVAQVLGEVMRYDEDANPLTTNFITYPAASIDQFPQFTLAASSTATSFNVLGAKGVGESGIIGSVGATHNAIVDALAHLGVDDVPLPCTPDVVWHSIRNAGATH
jgi:carbon-monoxide dehydrogenase large subunit